MTTQNTPIPKNKFTPKGIHFYDVASQRAMILIKEGHYSGWLCYQHPDGDWVTLRRATVIDRHKIQNSTKLIYVSTPHPQAVEAADKIHDRIKFCFADMVKSWGEKEQDAQIITTAYAPLIEDKKRAEELLEIANDALPNIGKNQKLINAIEQHLKKVSNEG